MAHILSTAPPPPPPFLFVEPIFKVKINRRSMISITDAYNGIFGENIDKLPYHLELHDYKVFDFLRKVRAKCVLL